MAAVDGVDMSTCLCDESVGPTPWEVAETCKVCGRVRPMDKGTFEVSSKASSDAEHAAVSQTELERLRDIGFYERVSWARVKALLEVHPVANASRIERNRRKRQRKKK